MGVIIFTANPLTSLKKLKLQINVLIFGQILTILGLISVTRAIAICLLQNPCLSPSTNSGNHEVPIN